ncbi:response regulator [Neptuniibacter sp. QD37_11]|uniref:response regulator n=1 Tax=Neptuniibacter sp. QD37_11 TaxID=3398209 RepID=UPI0039F4FB1E
MKPEIANATILVVDDMPSMRAITKKFLKHMGANRIVECENGQQALSRLKSGRVDLIICDWDMPVMNGYELLKAVKGHERLAKIPFLMLTANANRSFVQRCLSAKVNDYMVKPFQPSTFIEKVSKFAS